MHFTVGLEGLQTMIRFLRAYKDNQRLH